MKRQSQRPNRNYDAIQTRIGYRILLLQLIKQFYPNKTEQQVLQLEFIIYNRVHSFEYIQCATTIEILQKIIRNIHTDAVNGVNTPVAANDIISPAKAVILVPDTAIG
jgi:hypothetical protein